MTENDTFESARGESSGLASSAVEPAVNKSSNFWSVEASVWGNIVTQVAAGMGAVAGIVSSFVSGRAAKRMADQFSVAHLSCYAEHLFSGAVFPPLEKVVSVWDDMRGGVRSCARNLNTALLPQGRGRTLPLTPLWNRPIWSNACFGSGYIKLESTMAAEAVSFDSSFHRAGRRDTDGLRVWLASRMQTSRALFVSWLFEGFGTMLYRRAVNKNYFLSGFYNSVSFDKTRNPDFGLKFTPAADRGSDQPNVVPGGDNSTIQFLGYDQIMSMMQLGSLSSTSKVYVSRASQASELAADVMGIWAGSITEHAWYAGRLHVVCANLTEGDIQAIGSSWSVNLRGWGSSALLANWLRARSAPVVSGMRVCGMDVHRAVDWLAYHTFGVVDSDGVRTLRDVHGSSLLSVSLPFSEWTSRLSSYLGQATLEADELVNMPTFSDLQPAVWHRGVMIGALTDWAVQCTIGHWRNVSLSPGADTLFLWALTFVNLLCGLAYGSGAKVPSYTGISVGLSRSTTQRVLAKRDSEVALGQRLEGVSAAEPAEDLEDWQDERAPWTTAAEERSSAVEFPAEVDRVWLVLQREDWLAGLEPSWGPLIEYGDLTVADSVWNVSRNWTRAELTSPSFTGVVSRLLGSGRTSGLTIALASEDAGIVGARVLRTGPAGVCAPVAWACEFLEGYVQGAIGAGPRARSAALDLVMTWPSSGSGARLAEMRVLF